MDSLVPFDASESGIRFRGFVAKPHQRRASTEAQYFFVNGRMVRDRLLSGALYHAYRNLIPGGTYPAAILFLELPCEEIDVNVHPAKTEIRFRHDLPGAGVPPADAGGGDPREPRLRPPSRPARIRPGLKPGAESPYPQPTPGAESGEQFGRRIRDRLEEFGDGRLALLRRTPVPSAGAGRG